MESYIRNKYHKNQGEEVMNFMRKIRVMVVNGRTLFRVGIRRLLNGEADMEVVGEATNGGEAIKRASKLCPDVVLMDIGMLGLSSFEATRQIRRNRPETKVLFLTRYDDEVYLLEGMKAGINGYILERGGSTRQLLDAIREVHHGGSFFSPCMLAKLSRA